MKIGVRGNKVKYIGVNPLQTAPIQPIAVLGYNIEYIINNTIVYN